MKQGIIEPKITVKTELLHILEFIMDLVLGYAKKSTF